MSARGWADRLPGGRANPSSPPPGPGREPKGGHPEPGPGFPVRSNGPDRTTPGPALPPRPPVPEPRGSALRVVLVSRDSMLAGALRSLIEAPGGIRMLDWHSGDLDSAIRHADVVVVDTPPNLHGRTFALIDGRFLGRTVVLLQEGEHAEALPPGPPRAVLYRPLQIGELWAAVTGVLPAVPAALKAMAEGSEAADLGADAEGEGSGAEAPGPAAERAGAEEESGPVVGLAASEDRPAGAEDDPNAEDGRSEPEAAGADEHPEPGAPRAEPDAEVPQSTTDAVPADAGAGPTGPAESDPEAGAGDQAAAGPGPGLPVAESGLMIGLSGRELEPVIGPGQVAPGMDEETFERLRRWGTRGRQPAAGKPGPVTPGRAAGTRAGRVKPASAEARREQPRRQRAAKAEARAATRKDVARQRAARAEARAAAREQSRQAKAVEAEARKAAQEEARRAKAAEAEARRAAEEEARRVKAAGAAEQAAARAEARKVEAAQAAARAAAGRNRAAGWGGWVERGVQPGLVVVVLAVVAVGAAGWRADGGPDTRAGEVAVVRAAGGAEGGLVVQDPRVGSISPLHALAVGAWLRMTEAKASLEGTVREARVPGRFLLAGVVVLTVVLFLLLIRVGPGTGAAAGPGPARPQGQGGAGRRWRLGGAALAGVLVGLDPLLVRNGREATGTILALVLALGALALAWGMPPRPTLRWLPLVAALGGLALLASPLALPVLVVPVAAELLGGRHRAAWRSMAALALGIGVWLTLPIWVAGQDLGPGQAGWLLGRPLGRGSVAASLADAPLSWLLVAAGLAAAVLTWRHRSGARPEDGVGSDRPLAWVATTAAGALIAVAIGYPAAQALAFATPAAAVAVALAAGRLATSPGNRATGTARALALAGTAVALAGLVVAQGVDWGSRYGRPADDGLGRLVATVAAQVPRCSAVNAGGPDDRARLLAAGVTVTEFSDVQAAAAAGVRYFVLTGATTTGGPQTPSLAAWVREHGNRIAAHPSRSLSRIELWRVDPAPLDPVADSLPVPDGMYSNVTGSACGGYRVVDSQLGAFYTAYRAVGGKAVLGRPLGSVWTSDGPALQAFDTMVLGAVPAASGPPAVMPIELPPLLAKLDVEAVADADIPLPSTRPPVTDRQAVALLTDELIARAYLGNDPATATPEDWRRARDRFGRPLGTPQTMPDGAVRQPFEKAVLELPADGGPARPAALGRLAVKLGLVPKQAMRPEPVPGLPARPVETRLDTGPLVRPLGLVLALLALTAAAGAAAARRSRPGARGQAPTGG